MVKGGSSYNISAVPVTVFAQLLVISIAILTLVWLMKLHPLLMILGFVLFSGEAIIVYKAIPVNQKGQKRIQLILHFIALVAGIIGVYAVFKFHNERIFPHMYTLHSWIGLFGFQWVLGFFCFWYPLAEASRRARILPWHAFFGIVVFFMTIVTAGTGLTQKFLFLGLQRNQEALIINFTGLLILLFGIFVGLSVILPRRN